VLADPTSGLAARPVPVPRRFYVHDDLTDAVRQEHGVDSPAAALTRELLALVGRDSGRVTIITVDDQIERLVARGAHEPFSLAIGIGRAGERVARQVHARTGWFPAVLRVDATREEDGRGGYVLASLEGVPLATQLAGIDAEGSLALVDDTIFSGLTMRTILTLLPAPLRARTHAFCLRCVEETLPSIAALCPVTPGFAAPGRIDEEVSLINASGLVRRGSIRRTGLPPLAFFERPEWIHAWFPGSGDAIIEVCRRLAPLLDPLA
jgi:hypothetical protein